MKTKDELVKLKQEYESLVDKLKELSDDELKMVAGGTPTNDTGNNDDKPNVVINNGTGYCKAGFSGEEGPRSVFPNIVG